MEQQFNRYNFVKKNIFTFFCKIYKDKEFYYRFDQNSQRDIIEIQGLNDEVLNAHSQYFLKFLADIVYNIQRSSIEEALKLYNAFYTDYLNRVLDIHFYREFNNFNAYRISTNKRSYHIETDIDQGNVNQIDINYNLKILQNLGIILDKMYFNQRR